MLTNARRYSPPPPPLALRACTAAFALGATTASGITTHLNGNAVAGNQQGLFQGFTNQSVCALSGVHQTDTLGNDALTSGSLATPIGEFRMASHACSGGGLGAVGSAGAGANAGVDLNCLVSSPTLPPGTPALVRVNWSIAGRVTVVGTDLMNVQDVGQSGLSAQVALSVNNANVYNLTGGHSRAITLFNGMQVITSGTLAVLGDDRSDDVPVLVGQTIRFVADANLFGGSFAFGPAVTDGDAQCALVWGLTPLTPGVTLNVEGDPGQTVPPATNGTREHAQTILPPRPPGTAPCYVLSSQPQPARICPGGSAVFSVAVPGAGPYTYTWQYDDGAGAMWTTLADGPLPGIGVVAGSATPTLSISNAEFDAQRSYRCVVTGPCGEVVSQPAPLSFKTADYNGDGSADQNDITTFVEIVGGGFDPFGIDPDLTGDGNVDQDDVAALIDWIAGGPCP